jgi:hypothetical protein
MASPSEPEAAAASLSASAHLARKLKAHELADNLRSLATLPRFAPFERHLQRCIASVLFEGARTPARDRARVVKAMKEFGGDTVREIAKLTRLPAVDVMPILLALVGEGVAYESSERGLFFLKGDNSAR